VRAELNKLVNMAIRIGILLGVTALVLYGSAHADYADRVDVQEYVVELAAEHGFNEQDLLALFTEAKRQDNILQSIARPAERTLKWHEYRDIFLKEPRISQGLEFWEENAEGMSDLRRSLFRIVRRALGRRGEADPRAS